MTGPGQLDAVAAMMAAEPQVEIRSVFSDVLDQDLARRSEPPRTVVERWVEDPLGRLGPGGHWEVVEGV